MKITTSLAAFAAAVSLVACNKKETSTTTGDAPAPAAAATASSDLPKMSSPEMDAFMKEYDAFMTESIAIAKSKDMAKAQAFQDKATEFQTKVQGILAKATSDDGQKIQAYITKKAQELQEASKP